MDFVSPMREPPSRVSRERAPTPPASGAPLRGEAGSAGSTLYRTFAADSAAARMVALKRANCERAIETYVDDDRPTPFDQTGTPARLHLKGGAVAP
jgi:hypothetical protein